MNQSSSRYTFRLLFTAFVVLLVASALPWSDLTGNKLKDFNLFEDLFPSENEVASTLIPIVDPELEELMATASGAGTADDGAAGAPVAAADSADSDTVAWVPPAETAPVVDGHVVIECYAGGQPLERFRQALAQSSSRTVRIGVLGDSFIEGDIFTQDLRDILQQEYGGTGVGYVPMHSVLAGFRRSVRQSGEGWTTYNIQNMPRNDSVRFISGEYAVPEGIATARFRGSRDYTGASQWSRSRLLVIAPDSCRVVLSADGGTSIERNLAPSPQPQWVELNGTTTSLEATLQGAPSTRALGVYLDGNSGIAVDCMSSRGSSGLNLRRLNADNCHAIDYDLIIVEYGINALNANESDYGYYQIGMTAALKKLQLIYPQADIIVFGIADRGAKIGGTVRSLPTCNAMTHAQRLAAQSARVHFYDLRAAQGGENAIVDWRQRQLVNADYIHLNYQGGKVLAQEFARALQLTLQQSEVPHTAR